MASLSLFLARRFFKSGGKAEGGRKASPPAIRIATAGIAVGLAVMIVSVCVVHGFQREVSNKLTGFASHIEILDLRSLDSPETNPVVTDKALADKAKAAPGVVRVQRFSQKIGIFKTENDFAGIVLKGVGEDYDLSFLRQYIVEGRLPNFSAHKSSNEIVVSQTVARKLGVKTSDRIYSYYFSNTVKQRRFTIAGIYNTYMRQFDNMVVWADLSTVNQLNRWTDDQSSGLEVKLRSLDDLPQAQQYLAKHVGGSTDKYGRTYSVLGIQENPTTASVLSWLNLLDVNVRVILVIMICVAGFTMISGLLILILERTSAIGVLKALGATNARIRRTFLFYAAFIVVRGLFWGNVIGLGITLAQKYFHIVRLTPETYYVPYAPVELNALWIVGINVATLVITVLALIVPSYLVSRIQPAKAIRFD